MSKTQLKREYRTTIGAAVSYWDGDLEDYADDPVEPDGGGWVMCGAAIGPHKMIHWFWVRELGVEEGADGG